MIDQENLISEDEIKAIGRKAAEEAAKATSGLYEGDEEYLEDEHDEDDDEILPTYNERAKARQTTVEDIKVKVQANDEFDIFTDIGEKLAQEGVHCRYTVYKGGKMFTTEEHPYSWEKLQKQRGGGHYKVIAKDANNRYIKTQTRVLDDAPGDKGGTANAEKERTSAMDILALMESHRREAKEETKRELEEQRNQFRDLLTTLKPDTKKEDRLMELLLANKDDSMKTLLTTLTALRPQDNSQTIMLELQRQQNEAQKENMRLITEMQKSTMQMFEKMNDKFEAGLREVTRLATERMSSRDDDDDDEDLSPLSVMKMISDAEERGERRTREFFDMIDAKADEKAKVLADREPESTTDVILKNLLPTVAAAAMSRAQGPAQRPAPQPARQLPRPLAHKPGNTGNQGQNQTGRPGAGSTQTRPGVRPSTKKGESVLDYLEEVETNTQNATIVVDEPNRDKIIQIVFPLLIQAVNEGKGLSEVEEVARYAADTLVQNGVNLSTVERDVSASTIEQIITHYSLPDDLSKLLREFYVQLVKTTRSVRKTA